MARRGPPQTPKNTIEQNRKISDRQTIAVTDLLSEGPIYGLVDGQASVFLNDDRAAPLGQAGGSRSRTALRINLTNGSTSATITNGGANPLTISANGKKYLTIRGGAGTQTVVASNSAAGTDDGAIVTTLTTTGGASFFTNAMVSAPGATPETHVPFRLTRTSALHGVTDEGAGEGVLTTRTSATVGEFTAGSGAPGGIWVPEGTYTAEVDTVVEVASVSGVTVTLASAWGGTTGSYKFDISGTIVTDSDVVSQTQISTYEGVTTQFRVGTLSQTPFAGEGGVGSTAISNSGPSAGGSIEQSNNFGGSQAPKELIASSSSGFNLTASQIQEVDEARVVIAYANGFYAVSGKGKNKHTFIRYRFQIAIKKIGSGSFETPITVSPSSHTVHSGLYTNATTFSESFDLNQYRPFADFKIIIDRVDSHENPGFDGVGETFHDWQNVTAASVSNVTCIIKDIVTHPYSAMAKTTFSTKQFQGMPSRTYHLRGLKVQVPSNYVTREEAANGVANYNRDVSTGAITNTYQDWDGAFQLNKVYTNNPAWVFYDILTNNRYGLGDFLKATDIDKYALFKIARYCDELVDDGKGGTEPRFTANLYFTKQTDAFKVLKDMATIFRGMLYFIDGQILPVMDSPSGPIYNFSKANVIDGQFSYETTGSKTRVNQVIVTWVNPDANYKAEPLIVEDRQDIVKQNRVITENAVAMGAITEGQALRFGRWKLWTAANQREIVSFSTALNASFLIPGDIINIQDSDRNTLRYSGRVSNTGTRNTSTVPIDSSVTINGTSSYELSIIFITPGAFATSDVTVNGVAYEAGQLIPQAFIDSNGDGTYTLQNIDTVAKSVNAKATANATENLILNFGDTTRVEKRTLNNSAGATTSLTVSSAFTATPDAEAIWGLTEVNSGGDTLTASPKQYKILSMSEKSSNIVEIAAVEFYNEKFDAVDGDFNTYVADTVYPAVTATDTVPPVQSVFATNQMTNIALGEVLELHWIPPTEVGGVPGVYEHLAGFEISHPFIDRENHVRVMDPETTHFTFKDLPIGTHKIAVKVINVLDNLSEPEIITVTVSDKFDEPIPRTQKGIPYTGDVNAGMQMSNAGSFSFKNSTYTFKHPSTRGRDTVGTSNALSHSQDCSGMVATSTTEGNVTGEFLTDHYYLLLDNSETNDKIKLLRYHKPNGVGTPYFYDSGNGSSTTRFGSALSGTFTKTAKASKVTGSGTSFTTEIVQGDVLKLGTEEIEVSAVESNTVLYLAKATDTAHSGVQGFIPNIRIDYINDCIIARAFKKSSDNSFNFVPYAKTDGEVKNAPDVIADGTVDSAQIANDAIGSDQIADNAIGADQINVSLSDLSSGALAAGTTVASTPAAGDNSLKVATTQYADRAVSNLVDSAPSSLDTLNELAAALGDDANFSTTVTNSLASKAPLASPTFTGTVSGITKAMVGLGNVDNTSVADIRSGTTAANVGLGNVTNESKATMFSSPTFTGTVSGISKSMVGLGNVDNNSTATIRAGVTASNVGLGNVTNESKATMFSSPALTGTPTAPTATNSTSNTQIATTAFVHAVASSEASGAVNNAAITLAAGNSGIAMDSDNIFTVNQSNPETITISHADTSSVNNLSSDNSGNTFIQDIAFNFDTFGHVTSASVDTGSVTIGNGTLTLAGGVDLHINESTKTFSANQSTDNTITFDHDTISRTNNTSSASPGYGGTFTAIDSITTSTQGHVTAVNTKTITIPASDNTEGVTAVSGTAPIVSSGGNTPAISISAATTSAAGSMSAADKTRLDGMEDNATADQTAAEILTLLKTVDTNTSGLNAATLDSQEGTYYLDYNNFSNTPTTITTSQANAITANTAKVGLSTNNVTNASVSGSTLTLTRQGASNVTFTDTDTDSFIGLTDTPGSFTASKFLKVNSAGNAIEFVDNPNTNTNTFKTIAVSGQTNVVADSSTDTLTLAGSNITITTNASSDTITFTTPTSALTTPDGNSISLASGLTEAGIRNAIGAGTGNSTLSTNMETLQTSIDNLTVSGQITAELLDSDAVVTRDLRVGPTGDVALIGGTNASPTLAGEGAHINSAGDFFVGVHDGARIFFDQSAGTFTLRGVLTVDNLNAAAGNFGTLSANVANIGTLNTSLLDSDVIMSRDIRVGPSQSGAATIATSTTAASAMAVGEIFIITNLGSIGNNAWSTLAGTTTNSSLFSYRTYAVGDIIKVAVANGSLGSGTGIKLTGTGSHLTSAGDFLLGDVAAEKFLAFSTATSQLSLAKNIRFDSSRVELGVVASDQFVLQDIAGKFLMVARDDTVRLYHDDAPVVKTDAGGLVIETGMNLTGADSGHFVTRSVRAKDSNGLSLRTDDSQARIFIKDDGNVGIGETSPTAPLHITHTGGTAVRIKTDGDTDSNLIHFKTSNNTGQGYVGTEGGTSGTNFTGSLAYSFMVGGTASGARLQFLSAGQVRGTFDTSGNLGIGTTSIDEKLHVEGGNIKIEAGAVSTTRGLTIAHTGQTGNQVKLEQLAGGNVHGILHCTERALRISAGSGGGTGTSETLSFWTNASRAMTIDTSQNVGIGTTDPIDLLHVNGTAAATTLKATSGSNTNQVKISSGSSQNIINSMANDSGGERNLRFDLGLSTGIVTLGSQVEVTRTIHLDGADTTSTSTPNIESTAHTSTSGTTQHHIIFKNSTNSTHGSITTNGFNTTYSTSSDYRLKENVQAISGATSQVLSLNPVNFQWKNSSLTQNGFLAHEVATIVPEAVVGEKDGTEMQAIDQSKLIPILVKTIQELEARIAVLEGS